MRKGLAVKAQNLGPGKAGQDLGMGGLDHLGGGLDRDYHSLPVRANGDFYKIGAHEYRIFNANLDQPQDNLLLAFQSGFTAPATLEGTVFLVQL